MSIGKKIETKKQEKIANRLASLEEKIEKEKLTKLTPDELTYLIQLIGRSEFQGKDLQILYSITAKLQNQLKS